MITITDDAYEGKTAVESDGLSDHARFDSILIVTYGRSGSTLLQGVLNTLPGVVVRGENHDFCWGLYTAWKSLVATKSKHSGPRTRSPQSAFFGGIDINPDRFLKQAQNLLKDQICPAGTSEAVRWGFKEIRYLDHLDELPEFLDFLALLLPNPAIIFNTRDHDFVCKSGFWKKVSEQEVRKKLLLADRLFFDYARSNDNAFICRYERVVLGVEGLRPLFEFLGTRPDPTALEQVMMTPHSYDQKQETLKSGAQLAQKTAPSLSSLPTDISSCQPERPFDTYVARGSVAVFCVVKNEELRLPWFLNYYRNLGCKDFIFIDNGSTDGTLEYLRHQEDVFLYRAPVQEYVSSRFGTNWINELGPRHAMRRWVLLADIDEILAWPEQDQEGLYGLTMRAERLGLNRVFTPMVDVYPEEPCDTLSDYEAGKPFEEYAWLMDHVSYAKAKFVKRGLRINSGPRARFLNFETQPPLMSKQNLYYVEPNGFEHDGSHFDTYGMPSPLVVLLLHFKFLPDFKNRMRTAVAEGQYWNNAARYKNYESQQLFSRSLTFEGSVDFRSDEGLKKYIDVLSSHIIRTGLAGSVHLKKFNP